MLTEHIHVGSGIIIPLSEYFLVQSFLLTKLMCFNKCDNKCYFVQNWECTIVYLFLRWISRSIKNRTDLLYQRMIKSQRDEWFNGKFCKFLKRNHPLHSLIDCILKPLQRKRTERSEFVIIGTLHFNLNTTSKLTAK